MLGQRAEAETISRSVYKYYREEFSENQEPRAAATHSSNTEQHSPELTQNHRAKSRNPAPRARLRLQ